MENKFRALKQRPGRKLIDFGLKAEAPTRALILEVLDFVDDVVDELGTRGEMALPARLGGQRATPAPTASCASSRRAHDLRAVVDLLVDETRAGL